MVERMTTMDVQMEEMPMKIIKTKSQFDALDSLWDLTIYDEGG